VGALLLFLGAVLVSLIGFAAILISKATRLFGVLHGARHIPFAEEESASAVKGPCMLRLELDGLREISDPPIDLTLLGREPAQMVRGF
jgi:hypothetical protein